MKTAVSSLVAAALASILIAAAPTYAADENTVHFSTAVDTCCYPANRELLKCRVAKFCMMNA